MSCRIGLIAARNKPEALLLADEIERWLGKRSCDVISEESLVAGIDRPSVLVTLGGDGLIMRMAHEFPDIPLLGINLGKIGFLAMIEREDWELALTQLIEHHYTVQEGPTLTASLIRAGREVSAGWAINDVVIRAGIQMNEVQFYVDRQFVNTYPGDGMIVATPQGSTAYCMSAGGPVLGAGVKGFAVVPICPHSPIRTPLVIPEEALVELVVVHEHGGHLILDGLPQAVVQEGDVIQVRRGDHLFRLVRLEGMSFYQAFRTKFNFMIRPDAVPTLHPQPPVNGTR
jgi:NAD+ kinase